MLVVIGLVVGRRRPDFLGQVVQVGLHGAQDVRVGEEVVAGR